MQNSFYILCLCLIFFSCQKTVKVKTEPVKIAFLADVHLHDIYAEFPDAHYKGVLNSETAKYNTIRTMGSQLGSTRLFNENYFAFIAALDDLVAKNIKLVALPGDYSDDGQPINIKALKRILDEYTEAHGIQFLITTGNHDPVQPFTIEAGKKDFLGADGKQQAIYSDSSLLNASSTYELPPIISKEIKKWGYSEITHELASFGFFPKEDFMYWETPYSNYAYEEYSCELAQKEATLDKRVYTIKNSTIAIPDATYLVEPVADVWLLAIDGNVYIPNENETGYSGASIGYNHVLDYKKQLISWVKKVAETAKQKGKTLIAFSHYPMIEFNDGASEEIKALFGERKMQSHRIPNTMVAEAFADAGIQIHIGGHMHLNDTGVFTSKKGNTLFNIQTPSLAAHTPAYKIITLKSNSIVEVETPVLKNVTDFNTLFSLYRKEYDYLKKTETSQLWDDEILNTKNYQEFTKEHLKQLVISRFLKNDWPPSFKEQLLTKTAKELLVSLEDSTTESLETDLKNANLKLEDFESWNGLDMILDFYVLRSSDELSFKSIGDHKMKQYDFVCKKLMGSKKDSMRLWGNIFYKAYHGKPAVNFEIDLQTNTLKNLLH